MFCRADRILIMMCDVWQHGIDGLRFTVEGFLAKMVSKNWQHGVTLIFAEIVALKRATLNEYGV